MSAPPDPAPAGWEPPHPGVTWAGVARAKVNLHLRVLARDASGYHRIDTCFQALRLADTVTLEVREGGVLRLEVEGVPEGVLGPPERNLAVVAARCFLEALGDPAAGRGLEIRITKRIPHGAGLGGGSSDAAAVLRGLNELWGGPFSTPELMHLGGGIGSDVPFFVAALPRAAGSGRGERLLPLPPLPERDVLLLVPREPISTRWAYETLAEARARAGGVAGAALAAAADDPLDPPRDWETLAEMAVNDFEEALFPLRPELARFKEALVLAGAAPALLSGSGSSLFGVFADPAGAAAAAEAVRALAPEVRAIPTRTVGGR